MGLKRIDATANQYNPVSLAAALRIGFRYEGLLRFGSCVHLDTLEALVLPRPGPEDSRLTADGQHVVVDMHLTAMTLEDWQEGGKAKVDALAARPLPK